jgi:hypothetical protein
VRITSIAINVGIVLALPVLIPLAFVRHYLDQHRLRVAAERAVCPACGVILGMEALHRADAYWRTYVAELHRNHPGVRFRLVRTVRAICGNCGVMLAYRGEPGTFIPISGDGLQAPRQQPCASSETPGL